MKQWKPEEIKNLRTRMRLSQEAFGETVGVTNNYVYLLEKGIKTPGKTLKLLLEYIEREVEQGQK
jgi:DNA-binding transcriptional regulator YiaG